jgi:5-methylcytosine-specific restriction endonuclease McrBC regulatory subunit McrC
MSKKSNKIQGDKAKGAYKASTNKMPEAVLEDRGIGSSFAMAVSKIMDAAASVAGSKNGFLGREKVTVDSQENTHSSILPKGFDAKNKLS